MPDLELSRRASCVLGRRRCVVRRDSHRRHQLLKLLLFVSLTGSFASPLTVGLQPRYDHAALPGAPTEEPGAVVVSKGYTTLIIIHAVLGFLALQAIAPLAVMVATLGRSWPNSLWVRMHWRMQAYGSCPLLLISCTLAVIASIIGRAKQDGSAEPLDKHQQMGFTLLGLFILQLFLGYYAHARERAVQAFASQEPSLAQPEPKRRSANWWHIVLGITILTLGGLQITWGFDEYETRLGREVPMWIQIVHFAIAGVPPLVVGPFILVRGFLRLRRGYSFKEAFFGTSKPANDADVHHPPRRLFLNRSTYLEGHIAPDDPEKDDIGTSYEKGQGAGGRLRVDSTVSEWPGASTREEYESSIGHGGSSVVGSWIDDGTLSLYDRPLSSAAPVLASASRIQLDEEKASLLSSAAPTGLTRPEPERIASTSNGPSQIPYRPATTSPAYPPVAPQSFVPPPVLPPIEPVSSPLRMPSSASHWSRNFSANLAAFSPRLSFMPFGGASPGASTMPSDLTSTPVVSPAPSGESGQPVWQPEAPLLVPTVIPSPPPVPPRPSFSSPVTSIATDIAVENVATTRDASEDVLSPLARQPSASAQVESVDRLTTGVDSPSGSLLLEQPAIKLELANPDPPSDHEGGNASPLPDDSESSRLMDELEREPTVSTMRSGRSRKADEESQEAGPAAPASPNTIEYEAATRLAREQSGKWLSGGK